MQPPTARRLHHSPYGTFLVTDQFDGSPNRLQRPSPYPKVHADPEVAAVIAYLQDWFLAMEDGSADLRMPDPSYRRSGNRPEWTEDDLDRIIEAIDQEYLREVRGLTGTITGGWAWVRMGCDAPPGFHRLGRLQRLAFVQGLDQVLTQFADHRARKAAARAAAEERLAAGSSIDDDDWWDIYDGYDG